LTSAIDEHKKLTPASMNTMLQKQSREEAITKKKASESMPVLPVPPTNPGKK
jgi:hypothetical protein